MGGHRTTIEANKLAAFWAAIPHQIVDHEGNSPYFVVTIPLSDFLQAGLNSKFVSRVLSGELIMEPVSDETDKTKFAQWARELRGSGLPDERAAELEVRARLLRLSHRQSDRSARNYPNPNLSRADSLACFIARHYQQPLTAKQIAVANGVHPNYAMNLFKQAFGTTMTQFVTEHRISHAQRMLVTTSEPILKISLESGFQSLSRFNEAFKAACKCSPRDYRNSQKIDCSQLSPPSREFA